MKTKKWYEEPIIAVGMNLWAPQWYSHSIVNFDAKEVGEYLQKGMVDVGFTFQGSCRIISG